MVVASPSISVTVDGIPVSLPAGASALDAVNAAGLPLSQLCKDADMPAIGACRTCLVQIDGVRGFPASCSTPASDGMVIRTDTADVRRIRSGVIELTLSMVGKANGSSESTNDYGLLTEAAHLHGVFESRWDTRPRQPTDKSNPVFDLAMDACILCARCVNACQSSHQFIGAIDVLGAGGSVRIATAGDKPLGESICTTCGQCLSVCPTGAISVKAPPDTMTPTHLVKTTCPYCGVGCGIKLEVSEATEGPGAGTIVASHDDPDNLSSVGMLCVKGRFGYTFVQHGDRIRMPLIREGHRFTGDFREATWDEALDLVASRLAEYRGESFGTLCSAKATNEDGYVQQKFARLVMGSNNIDHCTRLCHAPSVEAMLTSLGSGATSNSYTDYETAGCLLVTGCDPTTNHPVAAARMRRAVVERGAGLIVINPRRIDMCDYAGLWLRPYPGTDVALLNAMAQVIVAEGLSDADFVTNRTEGYNDWLAIIDRYSPEQAAAITGVPADEIRAAARLFARPPAPKSSASARGYGRFLSDLGHGHNSAHQRHP